jgi:hypothetical protein
MSTYIHRHLARTVTELQHLLNTVMDPNAPIRTADDHAVVVEFVDHEGELSIIITDEER